MAVADAMISTLTQNVFTALMNQAQFALDFRGQFEQMKTRLDLMKAFLADTENLKRKNEVAKTALTKLREVLYEADNVLTDCLIRDEYRKNGACFGFSLEDPFFLHQTGKKLKDINSRMEQIEKTLGSFLRAPDSVHADEPYQVRRFSSQDFNPKEIIGMEEDVKKIKGWIFDTNEVHQQVAIVGMGGLGKTTIAQKIFHDNEVLGRFDKMIWVSVSRAYNEENLVRSMLERLGKNVSGCGSSQLLGEVQQVLADKTCLIVMDDVWQMNVEWWTNLCSVLPKGGGKRSCIIITTRNEGVASDMGVESSRIHKPNTLNDEHSWSLFSKFAFSSRKGVCQDAHFERLGKEITKKCGGLPLAIKTIGALLAAKIDQPHEWREISKSFHSQLTTGGKNSSVMASLQLSYDELPTRLKQCLLCFSIYPEDFEIRAEQIINWWIGEGLIQGKSSRPAAEVGYEYLSELIKRCLVEVVQQRSYDGRVYNCKVHDMVRELIITNAEEEAFCHFDLQGIQTPTSDSRWLGLTDAMNKNYSLKDVPKLRALLVLKSSCSEVEFKNFGLLRSLRVLDFSNIRLDEISVDDLFNWITSLKRLASLNLSGLQSLEMVPPSIRKLRNLQLFVLTGCNKLKRLPASITTLRKLIVLDVGLCPLESLPRGLGKLSYLQELSGFKVTSQSKKSYSQLLELKELTQLRVLRMSISDETEILENEMNILCELKDLRVLSIDAENCKRKKNEILEMLDKLAPPPSLQELYLRNYRRETLPIWVNPGKLSELQYLCIENGDLNNLTVEVENKNCHLTWSLDGLCLKFLTRLEVDWKELQKDMPLLRHLEVSHCYKLKDFPCSVKTPGFWRKMQGPEIDLEETSANPKDDL
ncbi:NB-ARC domain, LRR domain containing protein [Trema orientale]|uniref:NB-ARC domain, LRR domain containing protein n=1 Tax=Trema orientale TaxID=63057 RepID=A0A2P5EXF1_TREOI|nr:NB-ARC domain, LRR domain containing protein [Trema orientale]